MILSLFGNICLLFIIVEIVPCGIERVWMRLELGNSKKNTLNIHPEKSSLRPNQALLCTAVEGLGREGGQEGLGEL